jgi:hypothetical protein
MLLAFEEEVERVVLCLGSWQLQQGVFFFLGQVKYV